MTDEQAKEIAEEIRARIARSEAGSLSFDVSWLLKLYDDIQALKKAMDGLSFLGVGGGIKPVTKTE